MDGPIDDESESDVGWPTEHPVKRKNERRGSRMKEDGAAAASPASAAAEIASEKDIMLPEWLIELPEDLEVHTANTPSLAQLIQMAKTRQILRLYLCLQQFDKFQIQNESIINRLKFARKKS